MMGDVDGPAGPRHRRKVVPQLQFPPGYRFVPTDEELIDVYLRRKIEGRKLPLDVVNDVKIQEHEPADLVDKYREYGEDRWYFFTVTHRVSEKGSRRVRRVHGTRKAWKATGSTVSVYRTGEGGQNVEKIGTKRILVFYDGKTEKRWTMHEYVMAGKSEKDYVLCTIQKKKGKGSSSKKNKGKATSHASPEAPDHQEPADPSMAMHSTAQLTAIHEEQEPTPQQAIIPPYPQPHHVIDNHLFPAPAVPEYYVPQPQDFQYHQVMNNGMAQFQPANAMMPHALEQFSLADLMSEELILGSDEQQGAQFPPNVSAGQEQDYVLELDGLRRMPSLTEYDADAYLCHPDGYLQMEQGCTTTSTPASERWPSYGHGWTDKLSSTQDVLDGLAPDDAGANAGGVQNGGAVGQVIVA